MDIFGRRSPPFVEEKSVVDKVKKHIKIEDVTKKINEMVGRITELSGKVKNLEAESKKTVVKKS